MKLSFVYWNVHNLKVRVKYMSIERIKINYEICEYHERDYTCII